MKIPFDMILFLLPFLLASAVQSCKEVTTDCTFDVTKYTIDQVIADVNKTLKESTEFFVKYETNLHAFAMELESQLRADKIMLERLLKLQERHGNQFHKTDEFEEICNKIYNRTGTAPKSENEKCKLLLKDVKHCENCSAPAYDDVNLIYTCTQGFAFDVVEESRQVRCEFSDGKAKLVYEGNGTSGVYDGELTCVALPPEVINKHPCPYTCAETAECSDSKLVCACLKGYLDVSSKYDKPAGSICTKCNNSDPLGTDYVMLFDVSNSINGTNPDKMINFVENFLTFIEIDTSDNRFALVEFSSLAELRFPLTPKTKKHDIIETLKVPSRYKNGSTNTPDALRIANQKVYAKLPADSARPRVTILFTDGAPTSFYSPFKNVDRNGKHTMAELDYIMLSTSGLEDLDNENADPDRRKKAQAKYHDLIMTDLQKQVKKMRETYKAQIVTIYVGRNTIENNVALMRAITSEDEELSVDNFDDLKNEVLDKLQLKIC